GAAANLRSLISRSASINGAPIDGRAPSALPDPLLDGSSTCSIDAAPVPAVGSAWPAAASATTPARIADCKTQREKRAVVMGGMVKCRGPAIGHQLRIEAPRAVLLQYNQSSANLLP